MFDNYYVSKVAARIWAWQQNENVIKVKRTGGIMFSRSYLDITSEKCYFAGFSVERNEKKK